MQPQLQIVTLGNLEYRKALAEQEHYWQTVLEAAKSDKPSGYLLVVEHPPTITLGRRATAGDILFNEKRLKKLAIQVERIGRGGVATYHGPGQIVVYPILPLLPWRLSVKNLVAILEKAMALTCQASGLTALCGSAAKLPVGTWVAGAKVGAIGLQIKRGVSLHGLALNVNIDLDGFAAIDPCGLGADSVTSMERACKIQGLASPKLVKVRSTLVRQLKKMLLASNPLY